MLHRIASSCPAVYEGAVSELYGEAWFSYHHSEGDVTALHGDALFSFAMTTAACIVAYTTASLSSDTMSPRMRGQPHELLQNAGELIT